MQAKQKIDRRSFLKVAGVTVAASTLTCGGLGLLATRKPEIDFRELDYGDNGEMNDKILVAYASRAGSTGEVAQFIGQALNENGSAVEVRQIDNVTDLDAYQAVVLGSAIRMGAWLPEAVEFVEAHREALSRKPLAYFTVCMTLCEDTLESRRKVEAFVQPVLDLLEPASMGLFAGVMDYSKISFLEQMTIRLIGVPRGDFRNWESISAWAEGVHSVLSEM